MEIKEIQKILSENEEMTRKLLKSLGEAVECKKVIAQNERLLNNELFGQIPTKYQFDELEKIIYYFNRKKGLRLSVVADELGYHRDYIRQVSTQMNKKIRVKNQK
jgi:hypothetical protein